MRTGKSNIAVIACAGLIISFIVSSLHAREVGKFSYLGKLDALNGDTVQVGDTMVAMSEKVRAFIDELTDTIADTPSIFFIIDNSTSMSGTSGVDKDGHRFTVTSAFIDTIQKYAPQAEVGLAVFGIGLYYNPTSKPGIFQTITSPTRMGLDSTGAFVPLLNMNQTYGTQTGYEVLKEVLVTNAGQLTFPAITPLLSGTNINCGFDAALQAFAASKLPKKNQFIIFLSDGEANRPQGGNSSAFTAATKCPATFTIYFTSLTTVPPTIQTYTDNCKINDYSVSDSLSTAYAYNNTSFEALMQFLMENIFNKIINRRAAEPSSIVVNSLTATSWNTVDSSFVFPNVFPLTGTFTPFSITLTKSQGVTKSSNFVAETRPGASLPRASWEVLKWDRDVVFQSTAGVTLTSISRDNTAIQLRFDYTPSVAPGNANYNYTNVVLELTNTHPTIKEREILSLTKGAGNFFTGQINRVIATTATQLNNVFEHADINDTIIAIFRNNEVPKLPLDTIRVAASINISANARIVQAATKDINGNGYIDAISVLFDNDTSITASSLPANFAVQYNGANLSVTGFERVSARQYRLLVQEPAATAALQTSWTPTLAASSLERIDDMTVTCIDSCAPVIYRVIKKMVDEIDHTTDTVRVLFSEKIQNPDGTPFTISKQPGNTFLIWWGADGDAHADTLLQGIPGFFLATDSILYFTMSNNKNLTEANWVNIKAGATPLRDKIGNVPAANNRRVQVEVEKSIINARIAIAATKDHDGSGYIDAVVLTFDKAPLLSSSTGPANFSLQYGITNLVVTGIEQINARQYRLKVQEPGGTTAELQTSWTPTLTTIAMEDNIDNMTITCIDSCAPVIYRAIKVVTDATKRTSDSVKIMFSEKIKGIGGTQFAITNTPASTFAVWWGNTTDPADTILEGISTFTHRVNDSILYFMMSNNKDLGARNWMNIRTTPSLLRDEIGNVPDSTNRKVQVEIQSIAIIKTFPNPAIATKIQINNGEDLTIEVVKPGEKSQAKTIVLERKQGGSVIAIEGIIVPPPNTGTVRLTMKVYDVAGNSVIWTATDDLFSRSSLPGTSVYLYWNGFNQQKMKVAPGVYRAVVYVDYPPLSNIKDLKTIAIVGITQ